MTIANYFRQQRQQWNRNRSFQGPQVAKPNPASKPLQDKPPVPVSTATKNKLSIYQFGGQPNANPTAKTLIVDLVSDDEKENKNGTKARSQPTTKKRDTVTKPQSGNNNASKFSDPVPSDQTKKDFPSTPAARLALPDLIEMGDVKRAVQDISPEDRIEWDQHGSGSSSFAIRKARKRARSSSPMSSPAAQASAHFTVKANSLNAQVDPGSELWGRYSLNASSNAPTPQGPKIPALAHIIHTSSPQASKEGVTPRSGAGLRRTTSCGTQFPKRRRVGGHEEEDVFTESGNVGPSKLSVLIERVQEGLTQSKQSSAYNKTTILPAPDRRHPESAEIRKFNEQRRSEDMTTSSRQVDVASQPRLAKDSPVGHLNGSDNGDFDDDDLDDADFLDALTAKAEIPQFTESYAKKSKLPPDLPPQSHDPRTGVKLQRPSLVRLSESTESSTLKAESDEFDDSDEELFTAGLEDIVAKFDENDGSSNASEVVAETSGAQKRSAFKADSDDEFGDDGLDDVDFEAAELTATQSLRQGSKSLLPVRPSSP